MTRPYALQPGEGWTGGFGPNFVVKARELDSTSGAAFTDMLTVPGEEPGDHTHATEDEMFYVVEGDVTFRCDGETFRPREGGFVFLPRGLQHGYTLHAPSRLIIITAPPRDAPGGWGGLIASLESAPDQQSR